MTDPKRIKVLHAPNAAQHYAALRDAFAKHPEVSIDADRKPLLKHHETAVIVVFITTGASNALATDLSGYQHRRFPILPVVEDLRQLNLNQQL